MIFCSAFNAEMDSGGGKAIDFSRNLIASTEGLDILVAVLIIIGLYLGSCEEALMDLTSNRNPKILKESV